MGHPNGAMKMTQARVADHRGSDSQSGGGPCVWDVGEVDLSRANQSGPLPSYSYCISAFELGTDNYQVEMVVLITRWDSDSRPLLGWLHVNVVPISVPSTSLIGLKLIGQYLTNMT